MTEDLNKHWWQSYREKRLWIIFYLGFASGLPYLLILSTLSVWLYEEGVDIKAIGLFALTGLPFTLKFLWAPLKDSIEFPVLGKWLGRRRGWLMATQLLLAGSLYALSMVSPAADILLFASITLLVAFFSASQDIVSDAYRIEVIPQRYYGPAAAVHTLGYRLGMLVSGAGALYLTKLLPWAEIYQLMACAMLACAGIVAVLPRAGDKAKADRRDFRQWFIEMVWHPLADFAKREQWIVIILFILFFKLGDALATSLATPFYKDMGFTNIEIANITKIFGLAAFLAGSFAGGWMTMRFGIMRSLWVGGILQLLSNFFFAAQALIGHDIWFLTLTIGVENFTSGIGGVAFVAYLSSLCNIAFTATQYALLTSLMNVGRTVISSGSGYAVAAMGWPVFFVATAVAALPGLWFLKKLMRGETRL